MNQYLFSRIMTIGPLNLTLWAAENRSLSSEWSDTGENPHEAQTALTVTWFIAPDGSFLIDLRSQSLVWCLLWWCYELMCRRNALVCCPLLKSKSRTVSFMHASSGNTCSSCTRSFSKGRWKLRGCLNNFSLEAVWRVTTLASPTKDSN